MADVELLAIRLTLGITYSIIYYLHINESVSLSQKKLAHKREKSGVVGAGWERGGVVPRGFRESPLPIGSGQYWQEDERKISK